MSWVEEKRLKELNELYIFKDSLSLTNSNKIHNFGTHLIYYAHFLEIKKEQKKKEKQAKKKKKQSVSKINVTIELNVYLILPISDIICDYIFTTIFVVKNYFGDNYFDTCVNENYIYDLMEKTIYLYNLFSSKLKETLYIISPPAYNMASTNYVSYDNSSMYMYCVPDDLKEEGDCYYSYSLNFKTGECEVYDFKDKTLPQYYNGDTIIIRIFAIKKYNEYLYIIGANREKKLVISEIKNNIFIQETILHEIDINIFTIRNQKGSIKNTDFEIFNNKIYFAQHISTNHIMIYTYDLADMQFVENYEIDFSNNRAIDKDAQATCNFFFTCANNICNIILYDQGINNTYSQYFMVFNIDPSNTKKTQKIKNNTYICPIYISCDINERKVKNIITGTEKINYNKYTNSFFILSSSLNSLIEMTIEEIEI
jgi:hypothetical protein